MRPSGDIGGRVGKSYLAFEAEAMGCGWDAVVVVPAIIGADTP